MWLELPRPRGGGLAVLNWQLSTCDLLGSVRRLVDGHDGGASGAIT